MDVFGREVYRQPLTTNYSLLTTNLSEGIYFWEMISIGAIVDKGKITVEK